MLIEYQVGELCGSTGQSLTTGPSQSTDYFDLIAARHQIGVGGQLWIWLKTLVAGSFSDATTSFLFAFEVDYDTGFSHPRCLFCIAASDGVAILTADPESAPLKTVGKIITCFSLPYGLDERYARWNFVLGGTTPTIKVYAGFGPDHPPSDRKKDQVYVSNVGNP